MSGLAVAGSALLVLMLCNPKAEAYEMKMLNYVLKHIIFLVRLGFG